MIPSAGRIVHYTLSEQDAEAINQRRADSRDSQIASTRSGAVVHSGNAVTSGDVFPLVITRVWADEPTEDTAINGQVLLDGNDTLWVTSVQQGDGARHWREPARV